MKPIANRSYRKLFWTLALAGLALDQWSKYAVFRWLYPREGELQGEFDVIPGVFKFLAQFTGERETGSGLVALLQTLSGELLPKVNQGALFGLAGGYAELANFVFAGVSLVAAIAIIVWSQLPSGARDLSFSLALGLILAGTLGNFYDRLVFGGVRDFLYFYWINWPVFNVADCCLVTGALLLMAQAIWQPATASASKTPSIG